MKEILNSEQLEGLIGENVKFLRLQKNLTRVLLAAQAGISGTALRHLENGEGAHLSTFIRIARALGKEEWLLTLAPRITVNPLHPVRSKNVRQRASTPRKKGYDEPK